MKADFKASEYRLIAMWIILIYRIGNRLYYSQSPFRKLPLILMNAIRKLFVDILFQVDIPFRATIGKGLRLKHPRGIVIHPRTVIGDNCTLFHQTTIGVDEHSGSIEVARIGNGVYIGAGAKIIGGVTIGHNAKIGANAVVYKDVPDFATAVSQQTIIIKQKQRALI